MKKTVTLNDKTFEVMIPAHEIDRAVAAVAECLNADYGDKERPIFVGVLNGAFMFLSDLIKKIDFTCEISFVKLASYEGTCSTGNVECLLGLNNDIAGRHVIIVEDIVDTGRSIAHMYADLMRRNPASVEVCTPRAAADPLPRPRNRQRIHRGIRTRLRPAGPQSQRYLRRNE